MFVFSKFVEPACLVFFGFVFSDFGYKTWGGSFLRWNVFLMGFVKTTMGRQLLICWFYLSGLCDLRLYLSWLVFLWDCLRFFFTFPSVSGITSQDFSLYLCCCEESAVLQLRWFPPERSRQIPCHSHLTSDWYFVLDPLPGQAKRSKRFCKDLLLGFWLLRVLMQGQFVPQVFWFNVFRFAPMVGTFTGIDSAMSLSCLWKVIRVYLDRGFPGVSIPVFRPFLATGTWLVPSWRKLHPSRMAVMFECLMFPVIWGWGIFGGVYSQMGWVMNWRLWFWLGWRTRSVIALVKVLLYFEILNERDWLHECLLSYLSPFNVIPKSSP